MTRESGLAVPATATQTAAWADFDLDGYLDVFVGNEFSPSQLFRNRGDGTFVDVGPAAGVDRTAFTKAAVWADYDNDRYPDLYVSNYAEKELFLSQQRRRHVYGGGSDVGSRESGLQFPGMVHGL